MPRPDRRAGRAIREERASQGIDARIEAALLDTGHLVLTPVPAPIPRQADHRLRRGLRLRGAPADAVFTAFAGHWRRNGLDLEDDTRPAGRVLTARDRHGFELTLAHPDGDDPLLMVTSPPHTGGIAHLVAGLATAVTLGCAGPVLSTVMVMNAAGTTEIGNGAYVAYVWAPLLIVIGLVCLAAPPARSVGQGLLSGAAVSLLPFAFFLLHAI